jgi:hypothetical protein
MGMWNNFVDKLPWNAYAKSERELTELAKEFFGEKGIYKDDTGSSQTKETLTHQTLT